MKTSRDLTLTFDGQRCLLVKDRCEKENDSGFYRITAVNSMGQAESTCHVTIQGKDSSIFRERPQTVARSAPSILQMLEGRTVHEGEQIVLQVKIIGQPKPQILWYKDNQPLRDTHDHKVNCFFFWSNQSKKNKINDDLFFLFPCVNRFEIKMIFTH